MLGCRGRCRGRQGQECSRSEGGSGEDLSEIWNNNGSFLTQWKHKADLLTSSTHEDSALSVRIFPYPTGQSRMTKYLLERPSGSRPRYIYIRVRQVGRYISSACQTGQPINILSTCMLNGT